MSLFRSKPVLISGGGIAAVLLAAAVMLLVQGRRGAENARRELNRARRELEQFYAHDPFPAAENIELIKGNRAELDAWFDQLRESLREGQPEQRQLSPAGFIQHLNSRVNALRAQSPRVAGVRIVSDNFNFGFDAYLGTDAALPQPEHVQRLAYQLTLIERLAQLVYTSEAMRLNSLSRERFDLADAPGQRRPPSDRIRRRTGGAATSPADNVLFDQERFELSLRLRPEGLSQLLNRLSEMQPVVVVRELSIRKSGPDLRAIDRDRATPRSGARPAPRPFRLPGFQDDPADSTARQPAEDAGAPEGPPPREARLISGPDVDPPLEVTLEILVYRFNGE